MHDALAAHVPEYRARDASCMAAFYADAAPVARRFDWDGSRELERLGIETDVLKVGVPWRGSRRCSMSFTTILNKSMRSTVRLSLGRCASTEGSAPARANDLRAPALAAHSKAITCKSGAATCYS